MQPVLSVLLLAVAGGTYASSGDRSSDFINCVSQCKANHLLAPKPLPFALKVTRWTVEDDCKYVCMHNITDSEMARGEPIQQYYGKWPFWRLWGMQEPASVAFSLLNLWAHIKGMRLVRRRVSDDHPMKAYYILWSLVSMNAWVWSAVFHTRDLPQTEKLDYFSAALAIITALYFTIVRMQHLYAFRSTQPVVAPMKISSRDRPSWTIQKRSSLRLVTWLCVVIYVAHVSYLTLLPRFDYSYNMAFNLILGLIHNAIWLLYSLPSSMSLFPRFPCREKHYRPTFVYKASIFVLATTAATTLELFDFPPWGRIIDAHSLWHLVTPPIAYFWYHFLIEDSWDAGWKEEHRYSIYLSTSEWTGDDIIMATFAVP